jgi:hypothetical protein
MQLNFIFSEYYSLNDLGDDDLILENSFYFQLMGGGVGVISMFSTLPYAKQVLWQMK